MSQLEHVSRSVTAQFERPWLKNYPACVPHSLEYPQEPVSWLLERAAARWPDRPGCIYYDQQLTFSELASHARRVAAWLVKQGVQPGDRVGLLLPNTPEFI